MDLTRTEKIYSAYSRFYDLIYSKFFHESRRAAIRHLEIGPGSKVLEVGVGTGLSLPLYPRHCSIIGIDYCEAMLKRGWDKVRSHRLDHVQLLKMDASSLEFEDNTFDAVSAAYVISVVPDPRRALQEMIRVCKENGKIVLLNHFRNGNKLISRVERLISPLCVHIGFRTDLALEPLLEGMPLVIQKKAQVNPFRFWHLVQCRKANGKAHPSITAQNGSHASKLYLAKESVIQ
jgi:phosphatidylethanolamine/phosphatidyl-N-methylethanolamine N-methyltransferase